MDTSKRTTFRGRSTTVRASTLHSTTICLPVGKAAIDAGGDPAEIGAWITEAKAHRVQAEAELRRTTSKARVTRQQIEELINMTTDIAATLHEAEPAQMADAYRKLGVRLTYDPAGPLIRATVSPQAGNIGKWSVSEGGPTPLPHEALSPMVPRLISSPDHSR